MTTLFALSSIAFVLSAVSVLGCAASPPPPPAPAPVLGATPTSPEAATLADGRQVVASFFARDTHPLWERFGPELRKLIGDEAGLSSFRESAEKQLGAPLAVLDEHVDHPSGLDVYVRIARFERTESPIKIVVSFDHDRRIVAFGMRPDGAPKAAATTKSEYVTQTALRLPFDGAWDVAWGGRTIAQNQHAAVQDQRFAYDFLVLESGATHRGDGSRNEDYYAYGRPILAPGDGVVVASVNDVPENVPGHLEAAHIAGNHVILDHGHGEYSLLAHLVTGSVRVKVGDHVVAGQPLGRCGNSGHSSEPHLHFHLQDSPRLLTGQGLPAQFEGYTANGAPISRGEPVRGERIATQSATESTNGATTRETATLAR